MCSEKQKELKLKYAHLFSSERTPFNCWGFETEDGWNGLIENLLAELSEYGIKNSVKFTILQVKEKFASLRVYLGTIEDTGLNNKNYDEIDNIINKYEKLSALTCEITGKPGKVMCRGYWLKTLCKEQAVKLGYIELSNKKIQN